MLVKNKNKKRTFASSTCQLAQRILLCEENTWTLVILSQEVIQKSQAFSKCEDVLGIHQSVYFTHGPLFMHPLV